jgi:hypothetical protein
VNPQGNGCILKSQICEEGYRLNSLRDRCIPESQAYVPFPLLITAALLSLPIAYSKWRHPETLAPSCLIVVLSLTESIGLYVQLVHSYQLGIFSTFGLTLVAAGFLYGANLFMMLLFQRQISSGDTAFKHWVRHHRRPVRALLYLSGALNFKLLRGLYCRFLGKDCFNPVFDDSTVFFKPFAMISTLSVMTTSAPLLVGNVCGLIFMGFGYQLTINNIELTVIEIALLALMLYEKKRGHREETYYKVEPKLLESQYVMSAGPQFFLGQSMGTLKTEISYGNLQEHLEKRRLLENLVNRITYKKSSLTST